MIKLSRKKREELEAVISKAIAKAESYYSNVRKPKYIKAMNRYYANDAYQQIFPERLRERSRAVIRSVMSKIEWCMPSIMRLLYGEPDIIEIQGHDEEDEQAAEIMEELIQWQLTVLNNTFLVFYRNVKTVLKYDFGVIKVRWEREFSTHEETVWMSKDAVDMISQNPEVLPELVESAVPRKKRGMFNNVRAMELVAKEYDETKDLWKVTIRLQRLKKNQPVIEDLLPYEFIYVPDGKTIYDCSFVAHRKPVTVDYLRRKQKQGIFANVNRAVEKAISPESLPVRYDYTEFMTEDEQKQTYMDYSEDISAQKLMLYECYTKLDINNDGLLEDVIVWYAGNTILRIEENIMSEFPFFCASPIIEPEKIEGSSFNDLIGQYQDIKTAFLKEILINIARNNNRKCFFDPAFVDAQSLRDDREMIPVDTKGRPIKEFIQHEPYDPISPIVFNALEMLRVLDEETVGITKYTQGMDAENLNPTATGISLIMSAANQRIELIVRLMVEVQLLPMYRYLVTLNQEYIDQPTVIRLAGRRLVIRPDDIQGNFDYVVNSTIGLGARQSQLQALQLVNQYFKQFVEMLPVFLKAPVFYKKFRAYFERMLYLSGFRNVDDMLLTEEEFSELVNAASQLPPEEVEQ